MEHNKEVGKIGDKEEQPQGHLMGWETLGANFRIRHGTQQTTITKATLSQRSQEKVKSVEEKFHAAVKEAHKEYGIDPKLDPINIRMEDGPAYSMHWQQIRANELQAIWRKWQACKNNKGTGILLSAVWEIQKGMSESLILQGHADAAITRLLKDFRRAFDLW